VAILLLANPVAPGTVHIQGAFESRGNLADDVLGLYPVRQFIKQGLVTVEFTPREYAWLIRQSE
jgi:hypothetical protein